MLKLKKILRDVLIFAVIFAPMFLVDDAFASVASVYCFDQDKERLIDCNYCEYDVERGVTCYEPIACFLDGEEIECTGCNLIKEPGEQ